MARILQKILTKLTQLVLIPQLKREKSLNKNKPVGDRWVADTAGDQVALLLKWLRYSGREDTGHSTLVSWQSYEVWRISNVTVVSIQFLPILITSPFITKLKQKNDVELVDLLVLPLWLQCSLTRGKEKWGRLDIKHLENSLKEKHAYSGEASLSISNSHSTWTWSLACASAVTFLPANHFGAPAPPIQK